MANILEAATKDYGTPLLFTGDLVNHFSDKMRTQIRLIDSVKMTNHIHHELYTIDLNLDLVDLEKEQQVQFSKMRMKVRRIKH